MKKYLLLLFLLCLSAYSFAQSEDEFISLSKEIIQEFTENKFEQIHDRFDDRMQDALSQNQLKTAWESLSSQAGKFQEVTDAKTQKVSTYQTVNNISTFEKGNFNIQITFNPEGQISGLYFLPVEQ